MTASAPIEPKAGFISFAGTLFLGADQAAVEANANAIGPSGAHVADLALVTDGPTGFTGEGMVQSYELGVGSGNYRIVVTQVSDGAQASNFWDGSAWGVAWVEIGGGGLAFAPSTAEEVSEQVVGTFGNGAGPQDFATTITPDTDGLYTFVVGTARQSGTMAFRVGLTAGSAEVIDGFGTASLRPTAAEPVKTFAVDLEAGVEYFVNYQAGGGSVLTNPFFSLHPVFRNTSVNLPVPGLHGERFEVIPPVEAAASPGTVYNTGINFDNYVDLEVFFSAGGVNNTSGKVKIADLPLATLNAGLMNWNDANLVQVSFDTAADRTAGNLRIRSSGAGGPFDVTEIRAVGVIAPTGVSPRIGEFTFVSSAAGKTEAEGYLPVTPGTVVGGATTYPLWAAIYPEFVSGADIVFPVGVEGMFLRNLGGNAAAEGVFQADATAPNGLNASYVRPNSPVSTNVNSGGGNTVRSISTANATLTGDAETRPRNRAYQLYTIVDTYTEASFDFAPAAPALPDFSLTEQNTGRKWTDGKDIFEVVLDLSAANNSALLIGSGVVETLISETGRAHTASGSAPAPLDDGTNEFKTNQNKVLDQITMVRQGGFATPQPEDFLILQYTKP